MRDIERQLERVSRLRNSIVALSRRLKQSARAERETWTTLMVLGAIERAGGQATPSQIASELELRSSNLAQILNDLDQRELVSRTPDLSDKRKARLSLTATGSLLVRESRAKRDQWLYEAMNANLSKEEQAQLVAAGELMNRLALSSQARSPTESL